MTHDSPDAVSSAHTHKPARRRARRLAAVGVAAAVVAVPSLFFESTPATAYVDPTVAGGTGDAAGFIPAPNPLTYCASTEYFGFWTLNELVATTSAPAQTVYEDYAYTNDDKSGPIARFNATQLGSTNGGPTAFTPSVGKSPIASIGIVMNGPTSVTPPAGGSVTLSEPLFFSQWVFTDMDQESEGFDLTPYWATPFQSYDIYAPDNVTATRPNATWNFTGSTTSLVHFNAVAAGNVDGNNLIGRAQVDFYGPILGMDMIRSGGGGSGFATGGGCPALGVAKTASAPVWDPATEQFTVTYDVTVNNNLPTQATIDSAVAAAHAAADYNYQVGTPTQINVDNLQLVDGLDLTAFSGASIVSVTNSSGAALTPNASYDGVTDKNLLSGTDTLLAAETGTIQIVVAYAPDFANPDWSDCEVELANQALATGNAGGVPVKDESDNGTDPAAASINGEGGTDDPTPITFALGCQIGLSKQIVSGPTPNGDGSYNIDYKLTVVNDGDISVANPVVNDDLGAAFGADLQSSTTTNDGCTGTVLAPAGTCDIEITVKVLPTESFGPWENSADVTANVGKDGLGPALTDISQDGADPDPDGDGDPTNNSVPTIAGLEASIGLAKAVTAGPTSNGDGTYNAEYTLIAENTGQTDLPNVVIDDDLAATFGPTLTASSTTTDTCTGIVLKPGDTCQQVIAVTLKPGSALGTYDNSAKVTAGTGSALVTDTSQDGPEVDPDGDGDPTNNNVPTPIVLAENPSVGIAKTISDGPVNNGDGTYTLTYSLVATNTGDVNLTNVVIDDDLAATFGAALVSSTITSDSCANGNLAVAATCEQILKVVVKPGADFGPYENSATVSGVSPGGTTVTDVSQNGTDPDPDGDGDPTNNNDPTPVSFAENPSIGLAKKLSGTPVNNGDGTYTVMFALKATNTGDVSLTNVAINDDLNATFGAALVSASVASDTCTGITLAVGKSCSMTLAVIVKPGANLGVYNNTATVTGVSPGGTTVTDVSQDGTKADPDGDGDPTNNSDPTPVSFAEKPAIGLSKAITAGPTSNGDGTYTLTYTLVAENLGDVTLSNLAIDDDLSKAFGKALVSSSTVSDKCTGKSLAVGKTCTLTLKVVVRPGADLGPYKNSATVTGTSPAGTEVTDVSQNGPQVDPDRDGDATDNNVPTPVTFVEPSQIGLAKQVQDLVSNGDGTYTVTYQFIVSNTGTVPLTNVKVYDNFDLTFGDTVYEVVSVDASTGQTKMTANPGFTGAGGDDAKVDTDDLVSGTTGLAVGGSSTILVVIKLKGAPDFGPYINTAHTSGVSPSGKTVTDDSNDGTKADANGDGQTNDDSIPTAFRVPAIGLAKTIVSSTNNGDGTYTLLYRLTVTNVGKTIVNNVQVEDNLAETFAGAQAFEVTAITSETLTVNQAYNGSADIKMLAGTDTFALKASGSIDLSVRVTPGSKLGPYDNSATTSGVGPDIVRPDGSVIKGLGVSDVSQDQTVNSTNPDPDGDGDPTNNNDPTRVSFDEAGQIGVAKKLTEGPAKVRDGVYSLAFTIVVENTGTVPLTNVVARDDLGATFGAKASAAVNSITATAPGIANPGFNGKGDTALLRPTTLQPGESTTIVIRLTLTTPAATNYRNVATAVGTPPSGIEVEDTSQNQDDVHKGVDSDGDGETTDNNDPTPVVIPADPKPEIPKTGAQSISTFGLGSLLVATGLALLLWTRRRRSSLA